MQAPRLHFLSSNDSIKNQRNVAKKFAMPFKYGKVFIQIQIWSDFAKTNKETDVLNKFYKDSLENRWMGNYSNFATNDSNDS